MIQWINLIDTALIITIFHREFSVFDSIYFLFKVVFLYFCIPDFIGFINATFVRFAQPQLQIFPS